MCHLLYNHGDNFTCFKRLHIYNISLFNDLTFVFIDVLNEKQDNKNFN